MNRLSIVRAVCGIAIIGSLVSQRVMAQSTLSDEHIEHIRQNCGTAQTTLRQLFDNDFGLRKNRGSLYEDVSTKLMAPLSGRIGYNKLDGLQLGSIALQYNKQLDAFRASYTEYGRSMERTVAIDCMKNPVEFYESVALSRERRKKLYEENQAVVTLLKDYKTEFEVFAKNHGGGQ